MIRIMTVALLALSAANPGPPVPVAEGQAVRAQAVRAQGSGPDAAAVARCRPGDRRGRAKPGCRPDDGRAPFPLPSSPLGVNFSDGGAGKEAGTLYFGYTYATAEDVEQAYAAGFRIFRLPIREIRVQPDYGADLNPVDTRLIYALADAILAKPGTIVVFDWHGFGKARGALYGTAPYDVAAIVDLNRRFLAPYRGNDRVWLDLQNEPHPLGDAWHGIAASVVHGLRAAGIGNPLVIEGNGYSAAGSWPAVNGAWFLGLLRDDPKLIASPHTYFDRTNSGTDRNCAPGSETRIDGVIDWAEANHVRLLFGEMAWGNGANCADVRAKVLKRLRTSPARPMVTFWTWGNFTPFSDKPGKGYIYGLSARKSAVQPSPLTRGIMADWSTP